MITLLSTVVAPSFSAGALLVEWKPEVMQP
jgi:hypothetical protein